MIDPHRYADEAEIPEPGPDDEPSFDAPSGPAPSVDDPPGRSTEF